MFFIDKLVSEISLDLRDLVKKLAQVLRTDRLKIVALLHETQDLDLVDIVSSEISPSLEEFPTEMRALSWVLRQAKCPWVNCFSFIPKHVLI